MTSTEKLAKAIWEWYYPEGGSIYKSYESLPLRDRELLQRKAVQFEKLLSGKEIIQDV